MTSLPRGRVCPRAGRSRYRGRPSITLTRILRAGVAGALLLSGAAQAATTITQPTTEQPGNVVRSDAVSLAINPGGLSASRSSSTATYTYQCNASILNACSGANSPLSQLIVKAPDGTEVLNRTSPWKNASLASVLNGTFDLAIDPQPATAPSGGYRGGPWSASLSLAGLPAGVYTVTTVITNKTKTGVLGSCITATATAGTTASTAGTVTESFTFEYRPWQQTFVDYFEVGSVQFNTTPKEFAFEVDGSASPIVKGAAGAAAMHFFTLPDATVDLSNNLQLHLYTPPADPLICVDEPHLCLPPDAIPCDPETGCIPRIAVITYDQPGTSVSHNQLVGFFDLQTRAFVAHARTGGKIRVLASGGTDLDALLNEGWKTLVNTAAGAGIDLPHLLSQPVVVRVPGPTPAEQIEATVSLLEGIQLAYIPTVAGPLGPPTLGAGLIVHIGSWSGMPDKGGGSGYGLQVKSAEDLPALPALPSIGALLASGGKLRHIVGKVPPGGGQHMIALSVDTSPGAPNGLPVWLPLVSGVATVGDNGVEFIGDDLLTIHFELCLAGSCSGLSTLAGTGLAIFPASPLTGTLSIGELPLIWTTCTAGLGTATCPAGSVRLITDIDRLVADSTGSLLTDPAVQDVLQLADPVLDQLLGGPLGGIPGL